MSSLYSIGSMNQLSDALEAADFTPEDITKLKQFKNLSGIKDVLRGAAVIKYSEHLIDLAAKPFVPAGFSLVEHHGDGFYKFNPKLCLYLSKKQEKGIINGNDLCEELVGKPVLNANLLDYLLSHPEIIPEDWKGKYIFFWGTIYRDPVGGFYVRCLYWGGSQWSWGCTDLSDDFLTAYLVALES